MFSYLKGIVVAMGLSQLLLTIAVLVVVMSACSPVEDPSLLPAFDASTAAPIPDKLSTQFNSQRNLYWGDIHIHTGLSEGAWVQGVRSTPDDAYTFARGGEIEHTVGYGIKLDEPLDFAAVTDHAEYLGFLQRANPAHHMTNQRSLRDRLLNDGRLSNTIFVLRGLLTGRKVMREMDLSNWEKHAVSAWRETIDAAQRHNIPGQFTAFIAYEWTSMPESRNLHRNIIYRGTQVTDRPFSAIDSEDPRDLWAALERERELGMENFAIPHNGNLSNGTMYDDIMYDGASMHAEYAWRRMRNEPLSEIYQIKGASETHPRLSPGDEFADFEIHDDMLSESGGKSKPQGSYMRDALRLGMEMSHRRGFNPYRFGVIASTDSHNSSSPVEEWNYHGKLPLMDGSAGLRLQQSTFLPDDMQGGAGWSASGLAAVWATENTREALYDAMLRKETYATSGPRIAVRFFGGWGYQHDLIDRDNWVELAEGSGTAMGGVLPRGTGDSPTFAIWAMRDPASGNLDRIQVIKGWVDQEGKSHERVYNVAWSGDRKIGPEGRLPPVGNTVDAINATYSNSIGAEQLRVVWMDPDFSPGQEAFYYARVIEIPTPRWTTYDAKLLGIDPPEPAFLQERAVTSAIWYGVPQGL